MLWIWTTLLAAALLAWLLIALRRYERESAAAALREAEQLREEFEALAVRVRHLEAIAAADSSLSGSQPPSSLPGPSTPPDQNTPQRG